MLSIASSPPGPTPVRLLTIAEACQRLGCSRSHFYDVVTKYVPIRKLGSASRVRSDDLEAYILGLPPHAGEEEAQ